VCVLLVSSFVYLLHVRYEINLQQIICSYLMIKIATHVSKEHSTAFFCRGKEIKT